MFSNELPHHGFQLNIPGIEILIGSAHEMAAD